MLEVITVVDLEAVVGADLEVMVWMDLGRVTSPCGWRYRVRG